MLTITTNRNHNFVSLSSRKQNTCDGLTVKNVSHLRNKWILKPSAINRITERQRKPITSCRMSLEIASAADHFQAWGGGRRWWRMTYRKASSDPIFRQNGDECYISAYNALQTTPDWSCLRHVTAVYTQAFLEDGNIIEIFEIRF
jgi:hypothetical protein